MSKKDKQIKIFLYEPDHEKGELIRDSLNSEDFDVEWFHHYSTAISQAEGREYDVNLIEVDEEGNRGLDLIKKYCSSTHGPLCVSLYSQQNTNLGFEASRLGSQKIYEISHGGLEQLNGVLKDYQVLITMPRIFQHKNKKYRACVAKLADLINHGMPVLLVGEPGVGKSYLAEHVHKDGTNSDFKYQEVLCGQLKEDFALESFLGVIKGFRPGVTKSKDGYVGAAQKKGLLYMEKIQELPKNFQDVVASLIESHQYRPVGSSEPKPFTANFIASCINLEQLDKSGMDTKLLTLLRHNVIEIPSLRDCREDIIPNAEILIKDFCTKHSREIPVLSDAAKIRLYTYSWPNNYRELKQVVESAVMDCKDGIITEKEINFVINTDDLPTDKKSLVIHYLRLYNGNKTRTAQALRKSRPTLDTWLDELGINADDYKLKTPAKKAIKKKK